MSSPGVEAQHRSLILMALSRECHTTADGLSAPCTMPLLCRPARVFTIMASTALFWTSSGDLHTHDVVNKGLSSPRVKAQHRPLILIWQRPMSATPPQRGSALCAQFCCCAALRASSQSLPDCPLLDIFQRPTHKLVAAHCGEGGVAEGGICIQRPEQITFCLP